MKKTFLKEVKVQYLQK